MARRYGRLEVRKAIPWLQRGYWRISKTVLDIVFPRLCAICQREGSLLCHSCAQSLTRWPMGVCAWCSSSANTSNICTPCASLLGVTSLWIGYRYDDHNVAHLIHVLKFGYREALAFDLGTLLAISTTLPIDIDCIIPVPLDTVRLGERGFNQTLGLSQGVASITGHPINTTVLKRTMSGTPQAQLNASARWMNMEGVYRVDTSRQIPKTVLLIDDVTTTGATLRSAVSVLHSAGVTDVYALIFAHGTPPQRPKGVV